MANERTNQIVAEIFDGDPGADTLPERLCRLCVEALAVTGAGLALISEEGHEGVIAATDGPARLMEDLQFTLGEGPCLDASRAGRPVLQADLPRSGHSKWPLFGPAVIDAGVVAVFALPLQIGAIRLGVLDLYRSSAGNLDDHELAEALAFADAAVIVIMHLQDQIEPEAGLHPQLVDAWGWQPAVHQSTGIIAVQAAVGLGEALLLLRARAFADGRAIIDVARDVISNKLTFHPGGDLEA